MYPVSVVNELKGCKVYITYILYVYLHAGFYCMHLNGLGMKICSYIVRKAAVKYLTPWSSEMVPREWPEKPREWCLGF